MTLRTSTQRIRHRFALDPAFRRRFVFAVLGIFAATGWGSLLFCSRLFTVQAIELEGGKGIDPIEAKAIVFQTLDQREGWRPWSARHVWFIDKGALAERLKVQWYAETVQVETHPFSNIVRLIVKEQTNALFIKTPTQFLRVDTQGIVREELSSADRLFTVQRIAGTVTANALLSTSTESIIELPDVADVVAPGYRLPVSLDVIRSWFTTHKLLKQMHVPVRYIRVEADRIVLFGVDQIPVYLDPSTTLVQQINGLQQYYSAQKKKKADAATQFIDARIPGRIYVK